MLKHGVIDQQLYMVKFKKNNIKIYIFYFHLDWAQLTCVLTSTVVHKLWWSDLIPLQYICELLIIFISFFLFFLGTETDQGEYTQKIIDSLPLDKLVITWIQFLTILQDPSECGDVSVIKRKKR
jgi:hypothetical protein